MKRKHPQAGVRRSERIPQNQPPDAEARDTPTPESDHSYQRMEDAIDNETAHQAFPLVKLPRELRDRVYDFHLQDTCKESRLRDWGGYWGPGGLYVRTEPEAPEAPDHLGFFYEPVFIHRMEQDSMWSYNSSHQAREHPVPTLTLCGANAIAKEAWEYYANRLIVHTDALNRFQTWCEETLETSKFRGLRKLYVVTSAEYMHTSGPRAPYVVDEQFPAFLIQIDEDRKSITVSCRFALKDFALNILQANLDTLMSEKLKTKRVLDGRDVIEAMLALHNHQTVRQSRQSLVIGPLRKGNVRWNFQVDDEAIQKVEQHGKTDRKKLEEAVQRGRRFTHVVYRGRVE